MKATCLMMIMFLQQLSVIVSASPDRCESIVVEKYKNEIGYDFSEALTHRILGFNYEYVVINMESELDVEFEVDGGNWYFCLFDLSNDSLVEFGKERLYVLAPENVYSSLLKNNVKNKVAMVIEEKQFTKDECGTWILENERVESFYEQE